MKIDLLSSPLPRVVGVVSDETTWHALQPTDADLVELRVDALPADRRMLPLEAHERGVSVIGSYHDFVGTPTRELLHDLEKRAVACGADVLKVAFTPHTEKDLNSALEWLRANHHLPVALMGMGALTSQSRDLFSRNGSVLLYGYLGNSPTAPGQWSSSRCLSWRRDACEA